MVRMHDLVTGSDVVVTNVKRLGPVYAPPLSLSYNPAEKAILVSEVSVVSCIHDFIVWSGSRALK